MILRLKFVTHIILSIILFNSCNNKEIEDYWLQNDHYSYPVVINFFENKYIESPTSFDTLTYKVFNKKIRFKRCGEEISTPNYKLKDDTFKFIHSDSSIFTFVRRKHEHCILDLFSQLNINIALPNQYCKEIDLNGYENSLYLSYSKNRLSLNFNGEDVASMDTLKNIIWKYKNPTDELNFHKNKILLYADGSCPMNIIDNIRNQIAKSGILRVTYITYPENINYIELNGLDMRLPPSKNWWNDLPDTLKKELPPPPPLPPEPEINDIHHGEYQNLFVVGNNSIHVYKNDTYTKEKLNTRQEVIDILNSVEDYQKYLTFTHYTNEATYNDFVTFVNLVFSFYYQKREEYSLNEFGYSDEDLSSDNRNLVRDKFPIIISEISYEEFEVYKKNILGQFSGKKKANSL
ncbi:MAG: hypothetical protein C0597_09845 [Marinilabiliales bacterium]|nr:MAG: hypothetical protein C0597_09845 [Marinilabiliales bacterium]